MSKVVGTRLEWLTAGNEDLQAAIDVHRDLSTSLALDELEPAESAR
jgi:hypothetical protein